jgi:aryl-alcohol dehydrogenase-like predicted oxidoreductase
MLTGKYRRNEPRPAGSRLAAVGHVFPEIFTDECFDIVEGLERYAQERGRTLLELALSWLASNVRVASVIAGATGAAQLRANVAATLAWHLTAAELDDVAALTTSEKSFAIASLDPRMIEIREAARLAQEMGDMQ